ncbi:MAG TPA: hypothetical protein VK576_05105 [Thermoleophilia bacterium]|nr:hypothetical protein [Thermoleophilia bacterium]
MGLFHRKHKMPTAEELAAGGPDGRFAILDDHGHLVEYVPDDFDEIVVTADKKLAMGRLEMGWLLLDEVVGPGQGQGSSEIAVSRVGMPQDSVGGQTRRLAVVHDLPPGDVTTYVVGLLKSGRGPSS